MSSVQHTASVQLLNFRIKYFYAHKLSTPGPLLPQLVRLSVAQTEGLSRADKVADCSEAPVY